MTENSTVKIKIDGADDVEKGPAEINEDTSTAEEPDAHEASDEGSVETAEEKIASLEKESRENYDRYLRATAEFENYKKRTARETEDFRKYANETLLRELLPVVDNLERAILSAETNGAGSGSIVEGVDLTLKEILRIFEKFGVTPIDCLEKPFDPTYHQAVLQEESDRLPDNTVLKEFQKGYLITDRLLRPAMVVVSKSKTGGADAGEKQNEDPEAQDSF